MFEGALCLLLLGPPACGKTSICNWLHSQLGFHVLQPGEMLRNETKTKDKDGNFTVLGNYIHNNWNHAALGSVAENMLQRTLRNIPSNVPIVLDGHPRTVEQAETLGDITQDRVVCAILLDSNIDECRTRFIDRKRAGETTESLDIRMTSYLEQIPEIAKVLNTNGIFYEIRVGNQPLGHIFGQVKECMDKAWSKKHGLRPKTLHFPPRYVEPIEVGVCIQLMMDMVKSKRTWKHFNGRHAVSLGQKNIGLLAQLEYVTSIKIDGVRVMVLPLYDNFYMIDRSLNVKWLCKRPKDAPRIGKSLFDCEWVESENTIVIIDVPFFMGQDQSEKTLAQRMVPVDELCLLISNQEDIRFYPQKYWSVSCVTTVNNEKFPFKDDGLIFTPAADGYFEGTDHKLLKWKPQRHNTVDFLIDYDDSKNGWVLLGVCGKKYDVYATLDPVDVPKYVKTGDIVECSWNFMKKGWDIERVRTDRTTPNPSHIIDSVLETIHHPVTWDQLCHQTILPSRHPVPAQIHGSSYQTMAPPRANRPSRKRGFVQVSSSRPRRR